MCATCRNKNTSKSLVASHSASCRARARSLLTSGSPPLPVAEGSRAQNVQERRLTRLHTSREALDTSREATPLGGLWRGIQLWRDDQSILRALEPGASQEAPEGGSKGDASRIGGLSRGSRLWRDDLSLSEERTPLERRRTRWPTGWKETCDACPPLCPSIKDLHPFERALEFSSFPSWISRERRQSTGCSRTFVLVARPLPLLFWRKI